MKPFYQLRTVLLFSFLLLLTSHGFSQYNLVYRNGPEAGITSLASDPNGNYLLTGSFASTSFNLGSIALTATNSKGAAFISKLDANKNWVWAKTINRGNASIDIRDIAADNAGNMYVVGWFAGTISFGNISLTSNQSASASDYDLFVAKLNAAGTFIWAKKEGTKNGSDVARAVAVDGSGNIYITGHVTRKKVQQGEITDLYIAKYNSSGLKQWEKKYTNGTTNGYTLSNPSGDLQGDDITAEASGNVYVTGGFKGAVSFGSLRVYASTSAAFTIKLNTNGGEQWIRTADGNSWERGTSVLLDNSGNLYTCGVYEGRAVTIGTASLSGSKNFIAKYSSAGSLLWAANITSPAQINATLYPHVAAFNSPNGNIGIVKGEYGIVELSPFDGSLLVSKEFTGWGTTGYAEANKVATSSNGYIFAGSVLGYVGFENVSLSSNCDINAGCDQVDMFIIDYVQAPLQQQNAQEITTSYAGINIFPNPVSDRLKIVAPENLQWVKIFDVAGRELRLIRKEEKVLEMNLSGLPAGTYFILTSLRTKAYKIQKL